MKNKHCSWCDTQFTTKLSYQIYCSAECRDAATKEKIAEKYNRDRIAKRAGKHRPCKSCGRQLSVYNDTAICNHCEANPDEITQALKEIKGIANGKIEFD
jgi:ribosomal protein S14